jgi:RNA polymerase-binding transcription factor DksA
MAVNTAKFKERLEKLLSEVTGELKGLGVHNPENPSDWIATPEALTMEPDPNDAADRVEDWDERRALVATLEQRYNNIVRALKRIETGTYDTCEVCGKPIEEDRLEANPAARTDKTHREEESNLPG